MTQKFMHSYPINLLLQNRQCLVVGGGPVALRKVTGLLAAAAQVKVVAPEIVPGLRELAEAGNLELFVRKFQEDDLNGVFLVFFASDDQNFNQQMMVQAQSRRILSCAVDENWSAGDFITPASCDRNGLQLAITTGGRSCVRSKSVKNLLVDQLDTLAAQVMLTTLTVTGKNFENESLSNLPASVALAFKLISGVREFVGYFDPGSFEVVLLLSSDAQVNRLLRLILADAVSEVGATIKERSGEEAFTYLLRKARSFDVMQSFLTNCSAECRIGSGLKKLNSLLMQSEIDPGRGWQKYADYCWKL